MRLFEDIIDLMHGNGPGSATLKQHRSAMRMDAVYRQTANRIMYATRDFR